MLYFLIPIFNEEANLELLHKNLMVALPKYQQKYYVFSDDGSKDNSVKTIQHLFANSNFIILGDGINHGPGYAFNTGFEWILKHSKNEDDKIITLEADNTSDINILPEMLTISELGYGLVLASVYAQGGRFDKTSFLRKFISSVANLFLRFFFNIKILTLSSFYRVYSIEIIKKIKEKNAIIINEKGFISMIEILIKSIHLNATIIEVPMTLYSQKRKGKSKMKLINTMISYLRFLIKYKIQYP